MGTRSAAALTETWDVPAPSGLLYLGIDVGRRQHLAAAVPEGKMWDGSSERGGGAHGRHDLAGLPRADRLAR
jgi:hypothetical protein